MSCNLIQIAAAILAAFPGTQPTRAQVQNLAHFDVVPSGTTFTDVDGRNYVATGASSMGVSTEKPKFGNAGLKFIMSGYLSLGRTASDCFGTGDFTAEVWVSPNNFTGQGTGAIQGVLNMSQSGSGGLSLWIGANGVACLDVAKATVITSPTNALQAAQWNHLAVTRKGSLFTLWVNGNAAGTYVNSTFNHTESYDYLGWAYVGSTAGYFNGYMDELRIVKGLAVYSSNFTPSSTPYTLPTS